MRVRAKQLSGSVTVSVFKACSGGYVGRGNVHPALVDAVRAAAAEAKSSLRVDDGYVARCGDDLALVLLHREAPGSARIRGVGAEAFSRSGAVGRELAQHAASRNGGPELEGCELAFEPRQSEPLLCFLADKAGPGAWNVHLYRAFGDPFNTPGLIRRPEMAPGFRFLVRDRTCGEEVPFDLPGDLHRFLASMEDAPGRYVVREVVSRATGAVAATASTGSDPALLVRCHGGFPTVGEVLEAFAFPYAVRDGVSGGGPLMPVATTDETASRSDGPPRAVGLGFQIASGRLVGPRDLLADRAFDEVRRQAIWAADYLRRHGPFVANLGRSPEGVPVPES